MENLRRVEKTCSPPLHAPVGSVSMVLLMPGTAVYRRSNDVGILLPLFVLMCVGLILFFLDPGPKSGAIVLGSQGRKEFWGE